MQYTIKCGIALLDALDLGNLIDKGYLFPESNEHFDVRRNPWERIATLASQQRGHEAKTATVLTKLNGEVKKREVDDYDLNLSFDSVYYEVGGDSACDLFDMLSDYEEQEFELKDKFDRNGQLIGLTGELMDYFKEHSEEAAIMNEYDPISYGDLMAADDDLLELFEWCSRMSVALNKVNVKCIPTVKLEYKK